MYKLNSQPIGRIYVLPALSALVEFFETDEMIEAVRVLIAVLKPSNVLPVSGDNLATINYDICIEVAERGADVFQVRPFAFLETDNRFVHD